MIIKRRNTVGINLRTACVSRSVRQNGRRGRVEIPVLAPPGDRRHPGDVFFACTEARVDIQLDISWFAAPIVADYYYDIAYTVKHNTPPGRASPIIILRYDLAAVGPARLNIYRGRTK